MSALRHAIALVAVGLLLGCGQPDKETAGQSTPEDPTPTAKADALVFQNHYQRMIERFVDQQGRVVDYSDERHITTSEGQSYAMLFALVANDETLFAKLLEWTENNLAQGDLTTHLPAWLWGEASDGQWQVLDDNSASDADVVLAYALLQAGELWQAPRYRALGERLAWLILAQEVEIIGSQRWLLPGYFGFVDSTAQTVKLNLSYYALPLLKYFVTALDAAEWQQVYDSATALLNYHQQGFASDWVVLKHTGELAEQQQAEADYDAIRVYFWWALAAQHDASAKAQLARFAGVPTAVENLGSMAQHTNWLTGAYAGHGPIGFSAAVLPLLEQVAPELAAVERQRVAAMNPASYADNYYDTMLLLYGIGADQGCLNFNASGELKTDWNNPECAYVSN